MDELTIRVQSFDDWSQEARRIAKRLDAGDRPFGPASIAFATMEDLFRTLTPGRWVLLSRLRNLGPSSIRSLSKALSRDYSGVHSDVKALLGAGLIERGEDRRIFVPWSKITAEMRLDEAA